MPKSKRNGRGTEPDDVQKHTSDISPVNLGQEANKIVRVAIASTGVRSHGSAPTSDSRALPLQATTVVRTDADPANGNFSQGKISNRETVAKYADVITDNWRLGVEAFLEIARLCAEVQEQLDPAQLAELKAKLPFGAATFSKFRQIGLDARLRKPEVQILLPAAYTTIYAITCLNDEELNVAITEKLINPDVKREKLEKWRKERHETQLAKGAADNAAGSPASPVSVAADSSLAAGLSERGVPDKGPVPNVEAPRLGLPEPSEPMPAAATDVTSPSIAPTDDATITVVEGSSLSANDQAVLDRLNETWDRASDVVRAQFRARIGAQALPI
jgi:hypothetical protein